MENNTIIRFNFFDQALAERVVQFQESEVKTKEAKEALKQEIKETYKKLDLELKESIKKELVKIKEEHVKNLNQLEVDLKNGIDEVSKKYSGNTDSKDYKEAKFGLEIACKRAKIRQACGGCAYGGGDESAWGKVRRGFALNERGVRALLWR